MVAVDAQSIALFFFFTFMDERMALSSSTKVIKIFRKKSHKHPEISSRVLLLRALIMIWKIEKRNLAKGRQSTAFSKEWVIPPGTDLNPWREFQKNSSDEELVAVVLIKILKFKYGEVAEALGLSEGTIRLRLAKALIRLGEFSILPLSGQKRRPNLGVVR